MSLVTRVLTLKGPWTWSSPLPCGWSTLDWSFRAQNSGMKTFIRPTTEAYLVGKTFQCEGAEGCFPVFCQPDPPLSASLRCFLSDHIQWGCGSAVERHTAVSHPGSQPGRALHVLWGHEEEGGTRRTEGERRSRRLRVGTLARCLSDYPGACVALLSAVLAPVNLTDPARLGSVFVSGHRFPQLRSSWLEPSPRPSLQPARTLFRRSRPFWG